jgi:hypothetical protein
MQAEDVLIPLLDGTQQVGRRCAIQIDSRDGSLGALENHIFGFLYVQIPRAEMIKYVCKHPRAIAVTDDQPVSGRRPFGEVHDVWNPSGLLIFSNHTNGFLSDRFLRLNR